MEEFSGGEKAIGERMTGMKHREGGFKVRKMELERKKRKHDKIKERKRERERNEGC